MDKTSIRKPRPYIIYSITRYSLLPKAVNFRRWGLGRSPKRGEGGSPTLSPFPGERGLGLGIINQKFISKTDFFYNLTAVYQRLYSLSINLYRCYKWGLGRSPTQGEGGSPTFSPFPRGRGLGLGIINQKFISKTDFFYNLTAFHQRLYFLCTIVHTKNAAKPTTV